MDFVSGLGGRPPPPGPEPRAVHNGASCEEWYSQRQMYEFPEPTLEWPASKLRPLAPAGAAAATPEQKIVTKGSGDAIKAMEERVKAAEAAMVAAQAEQEASLAAKVAEEKPEQVVAPESIFPAQSASAVVTQNARSTLQGMEDELARKQAEFLRQCELLQQQQ